MISAGNLNEKIEIYNRMIVRNEYNEDVEDWSYFLSCRAEVKHDSGRKQITTSDEIIYLYNKTFIVRYNIPVREDMRIKYNDKMWTVLSIDKNREEQQITIRTELVNE